MSMFLGALVYHTFSIFCHQSIYKSQNRISLALLFVLSQRMGIVDEPISVST